jgi:hypothetical protein
LKDEEFLEISCDQVEFFFLSLTFFPTPLSLSLSLSLCRIKGGKIHWQMKQPICVNLLQKKLSSSNCLATNSTKPLKNNNNNNNNLCFGGVKLTVANYKMLGSKIQMSSNWKERMRDFCC